jgi:hypothetical protein
MKKTDTNRPTDHANIDLTQLHLDVIRGRAGGKVIWQPRILAWLGDKWFAREPLPAPYTGMTTRPQVYRALGVSDRVYEFGGCFRCQEDPAVRRTQKDIDSCTYEVLVETPVGTQRAVYRISPNSPWHMPVKWPISDEAEMKVAIWRTLRHTWTWDQKEYERLCTEWAHLGAPTMCVPRITVQKLFIDDMGVEETIFALSDWPARCEEYFEAMEVSNGRLFDVIDTSPVDIINFGDNIHGGVLSPQLFEKYVLPVYQTRCGKLHKAGKFCHAHWDGDCKPLLPYARETGLDGVEAVTPKPQGDVTLEETKAALGDMFLLDGIPAVYFDRTFSQQELIDCARKCIDLFAPNLVLGISDEISSHGDIERVRLVTRVVDDYNARI